MFVHSLEWNALLISHKNFTSQPDMNFSQKCSTKVFYISFRTNFILEKSHKIFNQLFSSKSCFVSLTKVSTWKLLDFSHKKFPPKLCWISLTKIFRLKNCWISLTKIFSLNYAGFLSLKFPPKICWISLSKNFRSKIAGFL